MLRLLSWTGCDKVNSPDVRSFVSKQDSPGSGSLAMSGVHKRKQSGDHQGQADRKRARTVEKQQRTTTSGPGPANPTASVPEISTTTAPTTDFPTSYLPSPPEVKMEDCATQ